MMKKPTDAEIENEPMFYQMPSEIAINIGNDLTRDFVRALPGASNDWVIDTRSMLLQPGMWPCIPGWHLDFCPRGEDGQPVLAAATSLPMFMQYFGPCPTEYLVRPHDQVKGLGSYLPVYHRASLEIEDGINEGLLSTIFVPEGEVFAFSGRHWHRGTQAEVGGWRWFARAVPKAVVPNPGSKVRKQIQVYVPDNYGW